jgi:hypothetical protein
LFTTFDVIIITVYKIFSPFFFFSSANYKVEQHWGNQLQMDRLVIHWEEGTVCLDGATGLFAKFNFFYYKLFFKKNLYCYDLVILKNINIFLNKKYFKNNYSTDLTSTELTCYLSRFLFLMVVNHSFGQIWRARVKSKALAWIS